MHSGKITLKSNVTFSGNLFFRKSLMLKIVVIIFSGRDITLKKIIISGNLIILLKFKKTGGKLKYILRL